MGRRRAETATGFLAHGLPWLGIREGEGRMDAAKINKVRELSGAGVMDAKRSLEANQWDVAKAVAAVHAEDKDRPMKPLGYRAVFSYNHNRKVLGSVVLSCQTDFVGGNELFVNLGHDLAQHVVGMDPAGVEEMLRQDHVRHAGQTVADLIALVSQQTGEAVALERIHRIDVTRVPPAADPQETGT
jgi:elongation factor Ts